MKNASLGKRGCSGCATLISMFSWLALWVLGPTTMTHAPLLVSAQISNETPTDIMDDNDNGICRVPKPSVGSARTYVVGANSFHIPLMDYLTEYVGTNFDPPISFVRETANTYLNQETVAESLAMNYDFMFANPYRASCFETEAKAYTIATQVESLDSPALGRSFNLTEYGAVLYVHKNRTDIQTLADVKGKKIGTNRITALAT